MFIVWIAITISLTLSILFSIRAEHLGVMELTYIGTFLLSSFIVIIELLKWTFRNYKVDNSKGIVRLFLGDSEKPLRKHQWSAFFQALMFLALGLVGIFGVK
jgi:hypothetical protein